jgi:hypothetical protein
MAPARASSEDTLHFGQDQNRATTEKDADGKDNGKNEPEAPSTTKNDEEQNKDDGPPLPVGALHSSLKNVWLQVVKKWVLTTLVLFCFILCILSLYWAVLFKVPSVSSSCS